ncbi:MAG: 23S rRNA (pseudouridine(1915)-N(3))-methyltransferase RlmH [Alphaproteobacteria bacterium]
MRTLILAVGRVRSGPERTLYEAYAKRLHPPPEIIEVEERRKLDPARRVAREAELLINRVPAGAFVFVLDGSGRALSSEALAQRMRRLRDAGTPAACFVIGGADGLGKPVLDAAGMVLSLGPMTWPHMLVRTLVVEQLYRAEAILSGHPYHRAGAPPGR